ncbi:MAG: hypothetical protein RIA65_13945 [Woeseia sp.]
MTVKNRRLRLSVRSGQYWPLVSLPLFWVLLPLLTASCAAIDEASVARTDRLPAAPFYKTYRRGAGDPEPAVVLPLRVEANTGQRLERLQLAMNAYLSNRPCCHLVAEGIAERKAPWLYIGSSEGETAPFEAQDFREDYEKYPPMIVHFARPGPEWKAAMRAVAARESASRVVVTQLDFVQYPKSDKGYFGKKVVLGSQHEERVRVLSAIDKPIEVLQLSGVVFDRDGVELCAGAEGIIGSDAPFWVQVLEAGKDIDDEQLDRVLHSERRDEIPGAPLNWQVAADQLLWNLLHRCS